MIRHWIATARYIRARINRSEDPKTDVQEFLGHDEQKTTENYISLANRMYKLYTYDWINRTLKKPNNRFEVSIIKSKQVKNTFVSSRNPSRGMEGFAEVFDLFLGVNSNETFGFEGCFGFIVHSLKSYFFFFYI